MTEEVDFNEIRNSIMEFTTSQGIPSHELHEHWQGGYRSDWNKGLDKDMHCLFDEMRLFQKALSEGDRITQIAALTVARTFALNLHGFFRDLFEDIERMAWSDEFKWPKIPENYKIPDRYNHPRDK